MREERGDRDSNRDSQSQSQEQSRAALAEVFLARRRVLFELSGNGIHVVAAYRTARHFRVPVPEWAAAERDRMDSALLNTASVKEVAPAMALYSGGGPYAVERARINERNLAIVAMVDHFKTCDRSARSFTLPDGRRIEHGMAADLRQDLELNGEFVVVGRRFDLEKETVEEIYYDTLKKMRSL